MPVEPEVTAATAITAESGQLAALGGDDVPGPGFVEITPAGGVFGEQPFFVLRGAYTLTSRMALEAEIGHNIGDVVSAFLHSAGVRYTGLRYGRAAAFMTLGFGTFGSAGGDALAAQDITRSHLGMGGGVQFQIRDDVAARLDLRHHRILLGGGSDDHGATLGANEASFGLTFSRRVWSPPSPSGRSTP
jgi:hypothetical protein